MIKIIRKKFPDIKRLVTYQDCDAQQGTISKAANWVRDGEVAIDWTTKSRQQTALQSNAGKGRWTYEMRKARHKTARMGLCRSGSV